MPRRVEKWRKESGACKRKIKYEKKKKQKDIIAKCSKLDEYFSKEQEEPDSKSSDELENCNEENETIDTNIENEPQDVAPLIDTIGINDAIPSNGPPLTQTIASNDFENESPFGETISTDLPENLVLLNQANDIDNTVKSIENCGDNEVISTRINQIIDLSDPGNWPKSLSSNQILQIVQNGPKQITAKINGKKFPCNENGRHFSEKYYNRILKNGSIVHRKWLVYSKIQNKVFCFACKLFRHPNDPKSLLMSGYNKWKSLTHVLKIHENSDTHVRCIFEWHELEIRERQSQTINSLEIQELEKEKFRWKRVLYRILDCILFLAQRSLAFRGNDEVWGSPSNGNVLGLIELLSKEESFLAYHVNRGKCEGTPTYLSPQIQNEFICLLSKEIQQTIIAEIKKSKYFTLVVDTTPDISHIEQMKVVFRYVNFLTEPSKIEIIERFFSFLPLTFTTGEAIASEITKFLHQNNIELLNCRGQCYDNGANMSGISKGVQTRITEICPSALYIPCQNHTLNLVVVEAVHACLPAVNFFGVVQRFFLLFSASPKRWQILSKVEAVHTLKPLSDTRWAAQINAVRAIYLNFSVILEALCELKILVQTSGDYVALSECNSLQKCINFEFCFALCFWHTSFSIRSSFHINSIS